MAGSPTSSACVTTSVIELRLPASSRRLTSRRTQSWSLCPATTYKMPSRLRSLTPSVMESHPPVLSVKPTTVPRLLQADPLDHLDQIIRAVAGIRGRHYIE